MAYFVVRRSPCDDLLSSLGGYNLDDLLQPRYNQRSYPSWMLSDLVSPADEQPKQLAPKKNHVELCYDVAGYSPKDLNVKVEGGYLVVSGKHEEKSAEGFNLRQFERRHKLTDEFELERLKSKLVNNRLVIELPIKVKAPPVTQERVIPIEVVKTEEKPKQEDKKSDTNELSDDKPIVEDAVNELKER